MECEICHKEQHGFDLAYLKENGSCPDCDTEENEKKIKEIMNSRHF